jgi:hypothetical protein
LTIGVIIAVNFKTLATIAVWALFIFGLLGAVGIFVMAIVGGTLFVTKAEPPLEFFMGEGLSKACLILSVVAMKLRKGL